MGKITLTQFLHPSGKRTLTTVDGMPDDVCKMAEAQNLSCECSPNGYTEVFFYSYLKGTDPEKEEMMIATNGPGDNSPPAVLERLIRSVAQKG